MSAIAPASQPRRIERELEGRGPRLLNRRGHTYDLPGTFAKIIGLAIEDYGLGFGLLSQYDTIDAGLIGHADIGIDRSTYLANVRLAAELRDRLWPLVSKPSTSTKRHCGVSGSRPAVPHGGRP